MNPSGSQSRALTAKSKHSDPEFSKHEDHNILGSEHLDVYTSEGETAQLKILHVNRQGVPVMHLILVICISVQLAADSSQGPVDLHWNAASTLKFRFHCQKSIAGFNTYVSPATCMFC